MQVKNAKKMEQTLQPGPQLLQNSIKPTAFINGHGQSDGGPILRTHYGLCQQDKDKE